MNNNLIGTRFGKLLVIDTAEFNILPSGKRERMWKCKCDCGNIKNIRDRSLKTGNTTSCGCYRSKCSSERMAKLFTTHGKSQSKLFRVWKSMIDRCENERNKSYKNYGGKGISVCEEWHNADNFIKWSKEHGYEPGLTVDRINGSFGYSPENCRWVDRYVQNNNTRRNHMITYKGRTQTMAQWAKELHLSYAAIKSRLNKYGWSVEKALETPVK